MTSEIDNLFKSLPEEMEDELFTEIINGKNIKIQSIVSKGHISPESGWYDQDDNEWLVVLRGEAKLSFENSNNVHLVAGSHLNIPAHTKHKVIWTAPNIETVWLVVHYK